jgi:hypothetical protein
VVGQATLGGVEPNLNDNNVNGPYLGLEYGQYTGLSGGDLRLTVASIINVALGVLGAVAVSLIVYAGFLWMTAAGNDEQVDKAKSVMSAAVIGLAIIMSAYVITQFVFQSLTRATKGGAQSQSGARCSVGIDCTSGSCTNGTCD